MMDIKSKILFLVIWCTVFTIYPLSAQKSKEQSPENNHDVYVLKKSEPRSIQLVVNFDHDNWHYKVGENAKIIIDVFENGKRMKQVLLSYEIGPEQMPPTIRKEFLMDGHAEIEVKGMDVPGFLRCRAEVRVGDLTYSGMATAGFDISSIKPTTDLPSDFMDFWNVGKKKLAEIPMNATKTFMPGLSNDSVDAYQICFDNIKGKMYGILCMPHKAGKYPAILEFPGAGVYPSYGDKTNAAKGIITLWMGIHGIPLNLKPSVYKDLNAGALSAYKYYNMDNKDEYYFRRVILGCLRAVDYVFTLPQFDGKNIAVTGSSQGGFLSLTTAALDSRINYIACLCPAMSDITGFAHGRVGGWPHLKGKLLDDSLKLETSKYYDAVNFARYVKAKGFYSWGYNDETTAPTTTYSVYNLIRSPKELHIFKEIKHEVTPLQQKKRFDWLLKCLTSQKEKSNSSISDLVLIYDGGKQRQPWTRERLIPYVYRDVNGQVDWLFDGFLFLEIFDTKRNIAFDPGFMNLSPATKDHFESLIDGYFSKRICFEALENLLDSLARKGYISPRKHKVIIGIPVPRKDFANWGVINGNKLDFKSSEDIVTAVKWYLDEALKRWKKRNYKYLELDGFYWVSESSNKYEEEIVAVSQYLEKIGQPFYWIPYYFATGASYWREYGFNYAYFQPNYFFKTQTPYSRLSDACKFARKNGLSMEMEFDNRLLKDTSYLKRYDDYVNVFTEEKVWEEVPIAYYEGGGTWFEMARSNNPEINKRYETLADIIAKRQKKGLH